VPSAPSRYTLFVLAQNEFRGVVERAVQAKAELLRGFATDFMFLTALEEFPQSFA